MRKTALITGITGQDGSYLAELLLEKGYTVYGILRRSSSFNTERIDHIFGDIRLVYGDLSDPFCIVGVLTTIKREVPKGTIEIYNLGAMSHVKVSFETPVLYGTNMCSRPFEYFGKYTSTRLGRSSSIVSSIHKRDVRHVSCSTKRRHIILS